MNRSGINGSTLATVDYLDLIPMRGKYRFRNNQHDLLCHHDSTHQLYIPANRYPNPVQAGPNLTGFNDPNKDRVLQNSLLYLLNRPSQFDIIHISSNFVPVLY